MYAFDPRGRHALHVWMFAPTHSPMMIVCRNARMAQQMSDADDYMLTEVLMYMQGHQ